MPNPQVNNIKLLIVDDEPNLLEQAKTFLNKEKNYFKIKTAKSAKEAFEALEKENFHAIISDYQMPETNGLEFLKTLRENGDEIPFIIFTGKGREEVAIEALNLGADRYLQKGSDPKSQYKLLSEAILQEVKNWQIRNFHDEVYNTSSELIAHIDEDGNFLSANKAMCESIGVSEEKIKSKSLFEIFPENIAEKRLEIGKEVIKKKETIEFEDKRDGKIFHNVFSPVNTPGEKNIFQVCARDITENKEMQKTLKRNEEKLKQLFEANPDPVYLLDEEGIFQNVNRSFCDIIGYDREKIIGQSIGEVKFLSEKSRKKVLKNFRRRKEGKKIDPYDIQAKTKSGDTLHLEINNNLLKENNEIIGLVGIARDITEKKLAEEEIQESEKRYRKTIENANIGIVVYGPDRNIKILNQKMKEITGYGRPELPTMKDWFEKLYPNKEKREKIREKWFNLISKKGEIKGGEAVITTKEGETRNLMFNGFRLDSGDVISFAQNITERKKSGEKFKKLFESAPDGALLIDNEGRFLEVSDVFCEKIGYKREELIGKSISDPLDFLPEKSRKKAMQKMSKRIEYEEISPYTIEVNTRNGKTLFVEINANPLKIGGELIGEIAIARDITERKKAEERQEFLQTMLRHDLRNKISTIHGYLDLLEETELDKRQRKYIENALRTNQNSSELIEKVSTLGKVDQEEKKRIELASNLEDAINGYKEMAKEKGIKIDYQLNKCFIKAGPLLSELFSNLIENSIKHSNCSKIRIRVKECEKECKVIFEDSGCGIQKDIRKKIFEKGYKNGEKAGSGLGMYLVKRIAENYGGKIDLKESELGGARFDVTLQKAESG